MSLSSNLARSVNGGKFTDTLYPDEAEVRKIHFKYGYYLDKCLYNEVVDMFADHPDTYVEFLGSRYRGKEGVKRLYKGRFQNTFVKGRNGPVHGFLLDHIMMQDIVDVDSTGTHAWVRMRALMSAGTHDSVNETHPRGHVQWWEGGLYENEYLKVSTSLFFLSALNSFGLRPLQVPKCISLGSEGD